MPPIFATGFMVGLMEWTCMQLMAPHFDAGEGSLGVHIDVSHTAATPPGLSVTVDAECVKVEGRRISFNIRRMTASTGSGKAGTSASSSNGTNSMSVSAPKLRRWKLRR